MGGTTHKHNVTGLHCERKDRHASAIYRLTRGRDEWARRRDAIAALPVVVWKGHRLRAFRCHGVSGRGSHAVNVPESLLFALHDLRRYFCPFHEGDCWARQEKT